MRAASGSVHAVYTILDVASLWPLVLDVVRANRTTPSLMALTNLYSEPRSGRVERALD
jgi:hypothetical protein